MTFKYITDVHRLYIYTELYILGNSDYIINAILYANYKYIPRFSNYY